MPRSPGPPTVRLRRLAAELTAFRAAAKLTREQVEEQTGVNQGTLWRLEKGHAKPHNGTLETLFDLYDVPAGRRAELIELARGAKSPGWLRQYREYSHELSQGYATYISFESEAKAVHNFETLLVPGLLQTEEYARATMVDGLPIEEEAVRRRVQVRMERQAILSRDAEPLQFWAVVDEGALHRVVGSREIMRAQLGKLLELSERTNVTLQVIPFEKGAHAGMNGSFARLIFGTGVPDLIYEERWGGDLFLELESEIDRYSYVFDQLRATALSPRDTSTLIAGLIAR
ncbi:helix-turn-helix domain-containing protein [Kribbella albertanoniae]|uniref:XRE family transcriptional regulator n=1 Tax=Kribbella albertanoniae TaxID=1266829 RepID=A0A4R4QCP0_9ACTN|nr:helix-turn-helix transcriptional regulator [Kribbella albertanoniae]TDC32929.1 XRE family transcriptional regulator [Kribbella albertanoniae]